MVDLRFDALAILDSEVRIGQTISERLNLILEVDDVRVQRMSHSPGELFQETLSRIARSWGRTCAPNNVAYSVQRRLPDADNLFQMQVKTPWVGTAVFRRQTRARLLIRNNPLRSR